MGPLWTALFLTSCSGFIEGKAADSTFAIMEKSQEAVLRSPDLEAARMAAPGGLVQLEGFHLAYPKHRGFLRLLAAGHCQYAAGFLSAEREELILRPSRDAAVQSRQLAAATRRLRARIGLCIDWSLKLLGSDWRDDYAQGIEALGSRLPQAKKSSLAGLNGLAMGIAQEISLDPLASDTETKLAFVEAALERSIAIDENYSDASALTLLATILSARGKAFGGDPERGKALFERARTATGSMLMIDILVARSYAVTTGNPELFRQRLRHVLREVDRSDPEHRLVNEMARSKAILYLEAFAHFFPGDAANATLPNETTP